MCAAESAVWTVMCAVSHPACSERADTLKLILALTHHASMHWFIENASISQ
jgi:hypothetical protein